MTVADLYAVLGVEPSATAEVITSAFRRQVRELRPDIRVDAVTAERFSQVRSAYETLRDPVRRAAYDRTYERWYRCPDQPIGLRPRLGCPVGLWPHAATALREPPLRAGPVRWEPSR
ncbi:J domain-containing protein [Streptomyces sp. NPDC052309]|uniref:J domain-containing protein n=1 Tax=Streptomyces sp. NPDC052309 TaxID=3155421 RepID=UPI003413D6A0